MRRSLVCSVYFVQNSEGTGLPPFECWLALRGLKTMQLRLDKASANAAAIAQWLQAHPLVRRVNYAALPGTPAAALNARQSASGGALLSFTTDNLDISRHVVENSELFSITVSFGSTSSLISLPCYMSHASIPAEVRKARGLPDDLVRISAGIEDVEDLFADLQAAFDGAAAKFGDDVGAGQDRRHRGGGSSGGSSYGGGDGGDGEVPIAGGTKPQVKVDLMSEERSRVAQGSANGSGQNRQHAGRAGNGAGSRGPGPGSNGVSAQWQRLRDRFATVQR